MRKIVLTVLCGLLLAPFSLNAAAKDASPSPLPSNAPSALEVTADKSLEWYEETRLYVARGNAKAVRGEMSITANILSAHEREKPKDGKAPKNEDGSAGMGDVDRMTAEGDVHIETPRSKISGDHAVYDLDKHVAVMTGGNLKYESDKETVTAKDSLEWWDVKKVAVARGHAVALRDERHVEGDVLTAQFRETPKGENELHTMTAEGNVTVITGNDIARGDKAVYDVSRNIAILTGNVRITRPDGMQLTGDVGEVDFAANQSRLLNEGKGRVRALLPAKSTDRAKPGKTVSQ